jgi:nucleotide-binding universal stress UspA family protein
MNTIRQILVHHDASRRIRERLALARLLAQEQGASLSSLYAVMPSLVEVPMMGETAPSLAAALLELDEQSRADARAAFDAVMREPGCAATWSEHVELPVTAGFAQQALFADLLVLGQRDPGDPGTRGVPYDFVESVIAASGKPALVVPHIGWSGAPLRTVVVAWKDTAEAARAVTAALPLLRRAQSVHVLEWEPSDRPRITGAALDLQGYFRLHGVEAQWHREAGEPAELGDLLLSRVADFSADLLVMGCYGHSRAREWILGGTTRTVLRSMTVPVLMAH